MVQEKNRTKGVCSDSLLKCPCFPTKRQIRDRNRQGAGKTVVLIYDMYLHGKTTGEIIKKLIEDGTPTPTGLEASHWCNTAILSILRNEKYWGDAILQKTYTKDFLNHKKCINYDAFPKYYVKNNHEEIIPRATWEYTQELLEKYSKRSVNVRYGDLIFCLACGSKYRRFH